LKPFGPLKVIDGTFISMAEITAVMVCCLALVPPEWTCPDGVVVFTVVSTPGSLFGFMAMTMVS